MKIKLIAGIKGVYLGYLFGEDAEITIGREIGNTIAPIIDNLSRHHAKIYFKDGDWYAEDCGSTNGSYVNGKKLEAARKLVTNDMLRCGLIDIQIELMNEQNAAVPAPVAAEPPPPQATIVAPVPAALKSAPAVPLSPVTPIKPAAPSVSPISVPTVIAPIAPAPAASEPEMTPVDDIPELSPEELAEPTPAPAPEPAPAPAPTPKAEAAPASPLTPAKPVIRKPTIGGGLKAGIKLPPKPGLAAGGLKLPPKPGLAGGLKLPPKPGAVGGGGLKPGLKLPPKPGLAAGLKLPPKSGV